MYRYFWDDRPIGVVCERLYEMVVHDQVEKKG